ncbi:hypothetical protein GGS26DRAFT_594304 [Hypomontagnella submonticulosa]|nr:hypothetical protein GGS26DRAFT_594304 [Hypomontagnella submonticulosa]
MSSPQTQTPETVDAVNMTDPPREAKKTGVIQQIISEMTNGSGVNPSLTVGVIAAATFGIMMAAGLPTVVHFFI